MPSMCQGLPPVLGCIRADRDLCPCMDAMNREIGLHVRRLEDVSALQKRRSNGVGGGDGSSRV